MFGSFTETRGQGHSRSQSPSRVFANNSVRNCGRVSRQKLKLQYSLFDSLNNSKYDYDRFKDRERSKVRGFRSQWNRLQLAEMWYRTTYVLL